MALNLIYKNIFAELPNPSVITDCGAIILDVNQAFETFLGYRADEIIGRSISDFFGPGFSEDLCAQIGDLDELHQQSAMILRHKDGKNWSCRYWQMPIRNAQAEVNGILHIFPGLSRPSGQGELSPGTNGEHEVQDVSITRDARLQARLESVLAFAQIDGAALWILNTDQEGFQPAFSWGGVASESLANADLTGDTAHRVLESQRVEYINPRAGGISAPTWQSGNPRRLCCLPFQVGELERGVIWFVREIGFLPAETQTLTDLADIISALFEIKKAEEVAQYRGNRLEALRKIEIAIKESYDLKVALGVLLDQAVQQLKVDGAAVLVLRPDAVNLEIVTQRGFRTSVLTQLKPRLGQHPPGKVASDRLPIHIPMIREKATASEWDAILTREGFRGYYGIPLIARGSIKGVLEVYTRNPLHPDPEWVRFLDASAGQAAIAVDKAELFENWQRANASLDVSYDSSLQGWLHALQLRDKYTSVPDQNTIDKTLDLALVLGVPDHALVHLRRGVILHDIGKIGVPDHILFKPGPLNDQEWGIMRRHPIFAYEMLSQVPYLKDAVDIPYCHHERWDGLGYPRGLRGTDIPLSARIFSVVDVWAAMTSPRPYREPIQSDEVRAYIENNADRHFDRDVVDAFLRMI